MLALTDAGLAAALAEKLARTDPETYGGAAEALCARGKSLLPAGVRACEGDFSAGEVVNVYLAGGGGLLGRGTVNYSSAELREIAGLSSAAAEGQFPGRPAEVIDQDNWAKSFDCEYKR